ncbi:MAG: hypothetical protein IJ642_09880 [Oscillospiraceae bacterium]|nr:hypothetical protein [Oscillospiraceae bacterium]
MMNNAALMLYVKAQNKLNNAQEQAKAFLNDEEGDTNFLSVIILLGIALALAAVFIGFKDQILGWFHTNADGFFSTSAGE